MPLLWAMCESCECVALQARIDPHTIPEEARLCFQSIGRLSIGRSNPKPERMFERPTFDRFALDLPVLITSIDQFD